MVDSIRISNVERRLRGSEVEVPFGLFRRHLGLPAGAEWTNDVSILAAEASDWYSKHGRPWSARREIGVREIVGDVIHLEGGARLTSSLFAAGLREVRAHAVVVVAISAGPEVDREIDRLWNDGRPDGAMFLNAYAISVTEHLRSREADDLGEAAAAQGRVVLPHYSPGYEGWELTDQARLYELMVAADSELPGPLDLLSSGALIPMKSTLAAFGIAKISPARGEAAVDGVDLQNFWTRRNTLGLDPSRRSSGEKTASSPTYSVPERTLERWASRRLKVTDTGGGRLHARFRFDGTTCSNMGLPLAFDYEVDLTRETETDAYRVLACRCAPAVGDTGHRSMCGYLTAPEEFMSAIQEAPVWTGRTLDELMDWAPETSLTGCLCTRTSRDHKWRVFIQTLHYALEKATGSAGVSPASSVTGSAGVSPASSRGFQPLLEQPTNPEGSSTSGEPA